MTSRRGFLGAIAAALVLDPERALWVPGGKKIFLPPAPRVIRPMFNSGDVVTFGDDPQRFVCMNPGAPDGAGATFSFLSGPGLPWGVNFPDKPAVVGSLVDAVPWSRADRYRFRPVPAGHLFVVSGRDYRRVPLVAAGAGAGAVMKLP